MSPRCPFKTVDSCICKLTAPMQEVTQIWFTFTTVSSLLLNRLQCTALCWNKGFTRNTGWLVSHRDSQENKFSTSAGYSLGKILNKSISSCFIAVHVSQLQKETERPEQALVSNCATKSKLLLTSQKEKREGRRVQTITEDQKSYKRLGLCYSNLP